MLADLAGVGKDPMTLIDLTPWLNAAVATYDSERPRGALDAWGSSFPAEELPFGSLKRVGGVLFCFPSKEPGRPDSVEPLGQTLRIPGAPTAVGIALLCCGEMGEQRVPVRVLDGEGRTIADFVAVATGVMIPAGSQPADAGFACSHFHDPGDRDLTYAQPAAWRAEHWWDEPAEVSRIELGVNPLFHLFGVTLLDPS